MHQQNQNIRPKRQRPVQYAAGARGALLMGHRKHFFLQKHVFGSVAARDMPDVQRVGSVRVCVSEKNKNAGWHLWAEI